MFKFSALMSMTQADFDILKSLIKKYGPETVVTRCSKVCKTLATETVGATDYQGKLLNSYYTAVGNNVESVFPSDVTVTEAPSPLVRTG